MEQTYPSTPAISIKGVPLVLELKISRVVILEIFSNKTVNVIDLLYDAIHSGVYYGLAKNAISETKRDRGIVTLEKMIPIEF